MISNFPIPPRMQSLKKDSRGYPIPFFVPIVDGEPNFTYQDGRKRSICMVNRLCAICGKKLVKGHYWFISGPMGLRNRVGSDAPTHHECAIYALNVCPHLYFKKHAAAEHTERDPAMIKQKPDRIFLVEADRYGYHPADSRYLTFRPVKFFPYMYVDNKLTQL